MSWAEKGRTAAGCPTAVQQDVLLVNPKLLGHNLGGSLLEGLANLELHHRAGGNRHVLARILGVTTNLGLNLLHGEGAEVAKNNAVAVAQGLDDEINCLLDNLEDVILREVALGLGADFVYKLAFCNCISHKFFALLKEAGVTISHFFLLCTQKKRAT